MSYQPSKDLNKSTASMSTGIFISRIFGFLRDLVIGYFFDRTQTDAFFVAFRLPNFFRRFFGESAITMSLIPTFIEYLYKDEGTQKEREVKARNLINSIYTLILLFVSTLTVLGICFMDVFMNWMFASHSFSLIEGKLEMTTTLAKILFAYLFLVVNYAYFTAIAQAFRQFFIPALAPASVNISIVACALIFPPDFFDFHAISLAVGVLIGGVIQAGLLVFVLLRLNFMPSPFSLFSFSDVKGVIMKFIPSVIGIGSFALLGLINVYFAGWLEEGVHTYIYYADRLLELPRALIAVSMGATLLPFLSKLHAQGKKESLVQIAASQRDLLLYIIVPATLGFLFLGSPIVEVLFARGEFDQLTVRKTAEVLQIYSFLLVLLCLVQVLSTCYFVMKNTWYPAVSTLAGLLVHIVVAPIFMSYWKLDGLILSTTLATGIQLTLLVLGYNYFIGSLYVVRSVLRLLPLIPIWCLFALYIHYAYLVLFLIFDSFLPSGVALAMTLITTILSSVFLYAYTGVKLKLLQALECLDLFKSRFRLSKAN